MDLSICGWTANALNASVNTAKLGPDPGASNGQNRGLPFSSHAHIVCVAGVLAFVLISCQAAFIHKHTHTHTLTHAHTHVCVCVYYCVYLLCV